MNVTKHARASKMIIQLSKYENELTLNVEDDGQGFDPALKTDGLGLKSLRSRVDYLNGELEIDSVKGEGTTVSVRVPV